MNIDALLNEARVTCPFCEAPCHWSMTPRGRWFIIEPGTDDHTTYSLIVDRNEYGRQVLSVKPDRAGQFIAHTCPNDVQAELGKVVVL